MKSEGNREPRMPLSTAIPLMIALVLGLWYIILSLGFFLADHVVGHIR